MSPSLGAAGPPESTIVRYGHIKDMDVTAVFSADETYRYLWLARWDDGPLAMATLLNPSTATHETFDPTVRKWCFFCRTGFNGTRKPFGGAYVGNAFAWRSTDPKKLKGLEDPVGPHDDLFLLRMALSAELVVCGWGNHGTLHGRGDAVRELLKSIGAKPKAFSVTGKRQPEHPLYLPNDSQPIIEL